ncbi:uncharacterized protein LOC110371101 [Helicoverpa armigera]|uniref:uncharacterized protein LOC110371101 n=1 Tax=Helicoverpa armigera TaxID=29058 RepID=UPI0030835666
MRAHGRVPSFSFASVILRCAYIYASITFIAASEYGVPIEIKLWDTGRTPLAHMVDVTNEFGLKVLAEHNFLNDNNIAFSPYGLMGIMVALYEGVDGESSYQIQRGMQLPWNRNVMRIGFRDIHRTLKTYFVPEEGFLAGLALNNENVTFNEPYKKILRFYGFDLENDQLPTLAPDTNSTSNNTSSATTMSSVGTSETTTMTVPMTSEIAPAREDASTGSPTREETTTTTNPNAETINTIDIREGATTAASPSSAPNAEGTSLSSTVTTIETTTERVTQTTQTATTSTTVEATTQAPTTPETDPPTTATTTTVAPTVPTEMDPVSSSSQVTNTDEPTTNNEVDTSSTTVDMTPSTTQASTTDASTTQTNPIEETQTQLSTLDSSTITSTITENTPTEAVMSTITETQQTDQMSTLTLDDMTTALNSVTPANESALETLERKKKSIVDFIFTHPPYIDEYLYRSYDIGSDAINPSFDDKMFLANGLRSVQVTYMRYDTVLEHAYLPHLEASALRLPLDSDRYYLLVVLPNRGGAPELGRLLSRMARESDLSDIYSVLRPRRVKGIVPSFTVKGHVTLTTDLQKLGIRDVFEPRQRDFTLMTRQPGVYVRSIEQAVSVAIRKYRPDDQKKNRYVTSRDPVIFSATYPFLYFVMDASIHVALMAGKMVDPLNSRIL